MIANACTHCGKPILSYERTCNHCGHDGHAPRMDCPCVACCTPSVVVELEDADSGFEAPVCLFADSVEAADYEDGDALHAMADDGCPNDLGGES